MDEVVVVLEMVGDNLGEGMASRLFTTWPAAKYQQDECATYTQMLSDARPVS